MRGKPIRINETFVTLPPDLLIPCISLRQISSTAALEGAATNTLLHDVASKAVINPIIVDVFPVPISYIKLGGG